MNITEKLDLGRDIEVANLMVKDLDKLYKSYAKKALLAKQERELKQEKKGFLEYKDERELADSYGWDLIDYDTYLKGLEYFENLKNPPKLSEIEQHRKNILELRNRWKGTVEELNEELNPTEKIQEENAFDMLARLEREERYNSFKNEELIRTFVKKDV